ncbi:hypothetical protein Q9233_015912 [Columba guinea]|nr:hypothetical protein Q9233_015912 [Columba guinea]
MSSSVPQDLLALLQEHGPSTEGIFRLAAGERASRELREALDSGAQVQLESQPVHLLAAILKEFLRKIPSKLLQAELYQDWMSALHNTSRQERLAGLKELVQSSSHHLWTPPAAKVELALRLDLLALLQEHGPSTEGIFRLAAGERASRELREALDSGAQVQLESQPVHLLAAILKEFLRKIPSKLLQAELYQDWMSALHNTSRQERLAGLKEVGLLPQEQARSSSHQSAALQKFRAELDIGQVGPCHIFTCTFPLQVPPVTLETEHLSSTSEESRVGLTLPSRDLLNLSCEGDVDFLGDHQGYRNAMCQALTCNHRLLLAIKLDLTATRKTKLRRCQAGIPILISPSLRVPSVFYRLGTVFTKDSKTSPKIYVIKTVSKPRVFSSLDTIPSIVFRQQFS